MSSLQIFDYAPTEEEIRELGEAVRLRVCQLASIDPERLTYKIVSTLAYQFDDKAPYFRVDTAEVTLDGREFGLEKAERKIRWWCQQVAISEHRKPDPARLRPLEVLVMDPKPKLVQE